MSWFKPKVRLAIDLGSCYIKMLGLHRNHGEPSVAFVDAVDVVRQFSMSKPEALADELYLQALQWLVHKHRLHKSQVSVILPADQAIIQFLEFPETVQTDDEVLDRVRSEFAPLTVVPFESLEVVVKDWECDSEQDHKTVLACAIPRDLKKKYQTMIGESGLDMVVMDLDAFAVYNAGYHFWSGFQERPMAMLHLGARHTIFVLVAPQKRPFFHIIGFGGNDLTIGVMEETGLNFHRAETWKKRLYQPDRVRTEAFKKSNLNGLFNNFAHHLIQEFKRSILHYQSREGTVEFARLLLSGGGAQIPLLADTFQEVLQLETTIWNPLPSIVKTEEGAPPGQTSRFGSQLVPSMGTLMRGD